MDITVPTTVVIIVWITHHVTNAVVSVTGDVTRDILMMTAAKVVFFNNKLLSLVTHAGMEVGTL